MTETQWSIRVDRVVVRNGPPAGLDATVVRSAIAAAIADRVGAGRLATGQAIHLVVDAGPMPTSSAAVGRSVGNAIARVVTGAGRRG